MVFRWHNILWRISYWLYNNSGNNPEKISVRKSDAALYWNFILIRKCHKWFLNRGTVVLATTIYQTKCPFTVLSALFLFFRMLPYDSRLFPATTYEFHQLTSDPAHLLPNSSSHIDLIFTDQASLAVDRGVHPTLHSNCHQIIFSKFNLMIEYPHPYEQLVWDYKKATRRCPRYFPRSFKSIW